MAVINNLYVFVESETLNHDAESTNHPVEQGIDITDHVKTSPIELSISGKIVDYGERKASDILSELKRLQKSGSVITYTGRNAVSNMQIQAFATSHPYTNTGGCDFSMTLREVRFAKPAYDTSRNTTNNTGMQQIEKGENTDVYHIVKKGDCVWNLVTGAYKNLGPKFNTVMEKCNWVMENNLSAFSRKGDFRTLQIGKKILVGNRK